MSEILRNAWWVIGLLALVKIGVLMALYQSRRTIKMQRKKEREMREEHERLLVALSNLREEHVSLARKQQTLIRHVKARLARSGRSASSRRPPRHIRGQKRLSTTCFAQSGRYSVTVMIPGVNTHVYTIHTDPKEQTSGERECVYKALRHGKEARAELSIDVP